jgi:hypothetical protein
VALSSGFFTGPGTISDWLPREPPIDGRENALSLHQLFLKMPHPVGRTHDALEQKDDAG